MKTRTTQRNIRERFMEKVDDCWQWKGAKNKDGYGQIKFDKIQMGAHVIAYELFIGSIPPGSFVLHSCDDPGCVNPAHLHLGDHKKNMVERKERGHYQNMIGLNNINATLTDEQVKDIRMLYAEKKYNQRELSEMYNVHQTTISRFVNNILRHCA